MARNYSTLPFNVQLRLLTSALSSKDRAGIGKYLIPFATLYEPSKHHATLTKNSLTLKSAGLLDYVVDDLKYSRPIIFITYLRILSFVDDYEDDLLAADCLPALMNVMKDNMTNEAVQIGALRFLSSLALNPDVQSELGDPGLELIELIVDLMESKALCLSPAFQTEAHLFCINLCARNPENKEAVTILATEQILLNLRTITNQATILSALYVIKNLVTNSQPDILEDFLQRHVVSSIIKALNRFPDHANIVKTGLACLTAFLHQRGGVKKKMTESQISVILSVLRTHHDNLAIMTSGFVVLLQLAKLRKQRETMGEGTVELIMATTSNRKSNSEFVDLGCLLLERLIATEANIEGLSPDEDIPLLLELMSLHSNIKIHHSINKLLLRLAGYSATKKLMRAHGGVSVLIASINEFGNVVSSFAVKTMEVLLQEDSESGSGSVSEDYSSDQESQSRSESRSRSVSRSLSDSDSPSPRKVLSSRSDPTPRSIDPTPRSTDPTPRSTDRTPRSGENSNESGESGSLDLDSGSGSGSSSESLEDWEAMKTRKIIFVENKNNSPRSPITSPKSPKKIPGKSAKPAIPRAPSSAGLLHKPLLSLSETERKKENDRKELQRQLEESKKEQERLARELAEHANNPMKAWKARLEYQKQSQEHEELEKKALKLNSHAPKIGNQPTKILTSSDTPELAEWQKKLIAKRNNTGSS